MKKIIFLINLVCSTLAFSQNPSNCLVGDWSFTGNTDDISGQANVLTLHGPTLTTDRFGNENSAYYFDGVDDYMEVTDAASLDFTGNGTISFWVKQDGDAGSLLWKRHYVGSTGWTIYFGLVNTLVGYVNDDATFIQGSTTSSVWQHVAMVSNAGTMELYINGSLVDSKTNASGFQQTNTSLLIGTDENHNYFNGTLDDVRIYNCALTSNDIISIYQESSDCLVGNWAFSGNVNDESGKGNAVSLHGGPTLTTDRFGNENSAYYFDGVDDYMEVADATSLDFEGNGTISLWVKQNGDTGSLLWKRKYVGSTGWTIYFGFANSIISYVNNNAIYVQGSTTSDLWQQVTLVSDNGTMKLYIDGSLADSKTNTTGFQKSATSLLIGTDENQNYFNGSIDDIKVYNCVLSSDQIQSLYSSPSMVTSTQDNTAHTFEVYPNPAKDKISISNYNASSDGMEISLLNSTGERVMSSVFSNKEITDIDISQYAKGMYLLIVNMNNTVVSKKIIIQ